ncbi:heme lyase CcmF/NrfE family subunit [Sphingomonas sp. G124]|uniref:Heme lyase CcmF/NrfE family subunit n=1 Tax=Sphingomonas cremea TaxID=2904799 RepID=A0A9X1QLS6_9SPHN|nr:heme lyase CcmF/NrfE family subunit [Sphingomonas cremea]MCF2514263.1 heme lyase CcmF/NrfE family subunit [Sphingomonas cremea]
MIAEAGLAALWLAAALAALQLALACGLGGDQGRRISTVRALALSQGLLTLFAFGALIFLFLRSDMSVLLVFENSHSQKPWLYKFAGTWGNHEGSMLLWVAVLAVAGAIVALFERRLGERTLSAALGAQAALALGFFAFLLFASNPFERLSPAPLDGRGLNPLLQDPGLAFHPPTLYLGYVGLSVAFSLAVGGLVRSEVGPAIARAMRPWVLGAWILLTLGITAGSYWAYYELGWGGWWFWDPVENASLMPWLAATALLHSINVLAARGGLRAWTMMLALIAFSLSMIGTFLVRSGILTSVHAFAVDPTRGTFILCLLALYIGGALTLFAVRIAHVKEGAPFEIVSREGGLVANNLLLSAILGIVFVGTLYPLIAEASSGEKLSVGAPYFNSVASPLALLLAGLMLIAPQLKWRRDAAPILPRLAPGLLVALAVLITSFILAPQIGWLPRLGLSIGAALLPASLLPLFGRSLRRTPLAVWGMALAHFGVAVAILGMASDSAFTEEKLAVARLGDRIEIGPWLVEFRDVTPVAGPNWSALEAELRASRGLGVTILEPQSRFFAEPPTTTNEAAIDTSWNGQLYAVLGEQDGQGRWQLRLWWKPFVTLIWLGGILIALGGTLALLGRLTRERRQRILGEEAFA